MQLSSKVIHTLLGTLTNTDTPLLQGVGVGGEAVCKRRLKVSSANCLYVIRRILTSLMRDYRLEKWLKGENIQDEPFK